ncbi:hypothetical protein HK097_010340 [Rhizophlyctis rosea]|uniref:Uncharacterized protein n=1 Tax=Rhizophlyctis rosea TaxID=64517 RepID=A0AAD5X8U9_9FUNG|nr:hypothetical protein HK097_010340 [Rhizophlyctis rosea]
MDIQYSVYNLPTPSGHGLATKRGREWENTDPIVEEQRPDRLKRRMLTNPVLSTPPIPLPDIPLPAENPIHPVLPTGQEMDIDEEPCLPLTAEPPIMIPPEPAQQQQQQQQHLTIQSNPPISPTPPTPNNENIWQPMAIEPKQITSEMLDCHPGLLRRFMNTW